MKTNFIKYSPIFAIFLLCLSSCVSKKQYSALQKTVSASQSRFKSDSLQFVKANDSLKSVIVYKDSLIDSLNYKLNEIVMSKREKEKVKPTLSARKSTLTKEQECEKKSLFIYNFTKLVEWPIEYNGTEFVIGVAGDDQAIKQLQNFMQQKKVSGKKIIVEKYKKGPKYNLVYILSSDMYSFSTIKNAVKKNKTLLVTDDATPGTHISFLLDQEKVRYNVDKSAIEKSGLKVGQELMRYAG